MLALGLAPVALPLEAASISGAQCVPASQNCTANDATPVVKDVLQLQINGQSFNPDDPDVGCQDGDTLSIQVRADFTDSSVGGGTRYDLAAFVGENGGNAVGGAACTVNYLSPVSTTSFNGISGTGPFRDDDGDACGDLHKTDKPTNVNLLLPDLQCRDDDGDGQVDISYLIAWQQNTNQACDSAAIAQGDTVTLLPGTSSKCQYEANANLNIRVEQPPAIEVVKTAAPTSAQVNDTITYSVAIRNVSEASDPVTISSLNDQISGIPQAVDLNGQGSCSLPQTIQPGASYSCQLTTSYPDPGTYSDVITASGTDNEGNSVSGQDGATVTISSSPPPANPALEVVKSAAPAEVDEPGGTVSYTVAIQNIGNVDAVVVTALVDVAGGGLPISVDGLGTCALPQNLNVGDTYVCTFDVNITSQPGSVSDVISATWSSPAGGGTTDSNQASVTVNDLKAAIDITKTASPGTITTPGGDVTFKLSLDNTSIADTITVDTLTDDNFGDLNGAGDCQVPQVIPPGNNYSCSFSRTVTLGDGEEHNNTVTASGTDDDGAAVQGTGSATVTGERPPTIEVTKIAAPVSVAVDGTVTYTIEITNTSADSDPVTIDTLSENLNGAGDVTLDGVGTCTLPQLIEPAASYNCEFSVSYPMAGSYADTVTASGTDDDGEAVGGQDDALIEVSTGPPPPTPAIEVTKTGSPLSLDEPGGQVTYSVEILNTGNVDGLQLTSLTDNIYGDITTASHDDITATTCALPQKLDAGSAYSCSFTVAVEAQPGSISDIVTATAATGLAPPGDSLTTASNQVIVTIRDVASRINVVKRASPDQLPAPGGDVSYTVTLQNPSADEIVITTLTDDRFGDLDGAGSCQVSQTILPRHSYSCSFTRSLTLADGAQHENTVTAAGTDDDGDAVQGSGSATVTGTAPSLPFAPIPTLAQWLLVLLAGTLSAVALGRLRQSARANRP